MQIRNMIVGPVQTNCYVLINEKTKEAIVIDPGYSGDRIAADLKENDAELVAILYTHGHYDHVEGTEKLLSNTKKVPVYCLEAEKATLEDDSYNMGSNMGKGIRDYYCDEVFNDGQEAELAGLKFKVLATPGHTPGGCCYYFPEDKVLFSGDTLFQGSVGRTDFKGGSMSELVRSIKEKLFELPEDTLVLPGHMGATTIGDEKMYNPFL